MIGVPGTAHRLFGALRDAGISVILISQGSSEHSICFAIPRSPGRARRGGGAQGIRRRAAGWTDSASRRRLELEHTGGGRRRHGRGPWRCGQGVQFAGRCRRQRASHRAGRLRTKHFGGRRRPRAPRRRCARCMPRFICRRIPCPSVSIGPGTVGRVLLAQIATQVERLRALNLDLRVRGIAGSKRMLLTDTSIDLDRWPEQIAAAGRTARPRQVCEPLPGGLHPPHGHHRLHGERGCCGAVSRMARARHPCRHAQQEGEQRPMALLSGAAGSTAQRRDALSVRGHRRRRPAGHSHAAGLARDGR